MPPSVSRRHFAAGVGASLLLALLDRRSASAAQHATLGARAAPKWTPDPAALREIPRLLELAAVPGLALGVIERGAVWSRGFGVREQPGGKPVDGDTLFEAASLGKPLFAVCVLKLRDAGLLDLDRPLHDYLPIEDAQDAPARRITARHVLSHTTGLPNWRYRPGPLRPAAEPGREYSYSGEGFAWLQRVVERLTDRPFARHAEEQVLRPYGMSASSYVWRPAMAARLAAGYDDRGERLDVYASMGRRFEQVAERWGKPIEEWRYEDAARAVPLAFPDLPALPCYTMPNAAGSLFSTAADYARFLARMSGGADALGVSGESWREMLAPAVRLNSALAWGLGWGLQEDGGGSYYWHYGANGSFRSFAIGEAAGARAAVAFTNSAQGPKVYQRVLARITGRDHPAFLW